MVDKMFKTVEKMFFFLPYLLTITRFWQSVQIPIEMIYTCMIGGNLW